VSDAADDARAVEVRAEEEGVGLIGVSTSDAGQSLIPWDQAIAVARRIIELARARGDLT
jgi:hypothetical protein